jgi:hypothetical protein
MKNITITKNEIDLERDIELHNGALVLKKYKGTITDVYMVVSFRDNKNRYNGDSTGKYCSLVNLDTGYYAFEERCSRKTTVKRVLSHLCQLNGNPYDFHTGGQYDIEVLEVGSYKLNVSL